MERILPADQSALGLELGLEVDPYLVQQPALVVGMEPLVAALLVLSYIRLPRPWVCHLLPDKIEIRNGSDVKREGRRMQISMD